jgi:type II secretory pathway pseudopilin PulG
MRRDCGFSLIELLVVITVTITICAIAVPGVLANLDRLKVAARARDVQIELQAARLKALSANRAMRLHFDCPAAGQYRITELIGTPAVPDPKDGAPDRCSPTTYPYPPTDTNQLTLPNNDGPVRYLGAGARFSASRTIEFWPNGTAHIDTGAGSPWPAIVNDVTISVMYKNLTRSITVNGVGKIKGQ